jgi:N-acetylglucosaminyldiphosphoundecaprenol N-acetyl-beta-D-mannosaminyltransferase
MTDLLGVGSARPGTGTITSSHPSHDGLAGGRVVLHLVSSAGDADDADARPLARSILGVRVDATTYDEASARILEWAVAGERRYVCVATVNNVIEARDDAGYREVMNAADLVTPDGMPLVWGLRLLGVPGASRVYGPDLTPILCRRAQALGVPVGLYGATPQVLEAFAGNLRSRFPRLEIAYAYSPPFRDLRRREDERIVADINASGAELLLVGLGAPKQERWMADHLGRVVPVMVGVGAAFDFLAGTKRMAPGWIQRAGMEWCYRLAHEPRRLWRRYLYRNPRFVALFGAQVARHRLSSRRRAGTLHVGTASEG